MTPNNSRKFQKHFQTSYSWKLSESRQSKVLGVLEQTRAEHPEDPSYKSLKIVKMESISIKKHDMEI